MQATDDWFDSCLQQTQTDVRNPSEKPETIQQKHEHFGQECSWWEWSLHWVCRNTTTAATAAIAAIAATAIASSCILCSFPGSIRKVAVQSSLISASDVISGAHQKVTEVASSAVQVSPTF